MSRGPLHSRDKLAREALRRASIRHGYPNGPERALEAVARLARIYRTRYFQLALMDATAVHKAGKGEIGCGICNGIIAHTDSCPAYDPLVTELIAKLDALYRKEDQ